MSTCTNTYPVLGLVDLLNHTGRVCNVLLSACNNIRFHVSLDVDSVRTANGAVLDLVALLYMPLAKACEQRNARTDLVTDHCDCKIEVGDVKWMKVGD